MTTTTLHSPFQHLADTQPLSVSHALKIASLWYQRAHQRHQLSRLSMDQLQDIGITRESAMMEAARPFWQG